MIVIKRYRNEWKYRCSNQDFGILDSCLSALLTRDVHSGDCGNYEIHSLYFDDYKDSCVKENEAGIGKRFKYRIRYYGSQCQDLKLECKQKIYERSYKESCLISEKEYRLIVNGSVDELFWQTDKPLLKRFCVQAMARHFTPKAIINYKRTAYTDEFMNIRVTLDEDISAADDFGHFLSGDYMRYPICNEGQHVLEVKFDYLLPGYIRHAITNCNTVQSSISKYCLGRRTLQSILR